MDAGVIRSVMSRQEGAITLWRCGEGYQANVRVAGTGWTVVIETDPVAALTEALRQAGRHPALASTRQRSRADFEDLLG